MKKSKSAGIGIPSSSKPGSRVTMEDIARAIGITKSAVSLALRNHPRISPARREEIQAVATQMGYQPNAAATALAHFKQQSKSAPVQSAIAWINAWPNPKMLFSFREFELFWQGALKAAEKFGYRLEQFIVNKEMSLAQVERILHARGMNGVIIPPHGEIRVDWNTLHWERFSAVRLGRTLEGLLPFHSVTTDQVANGSLAFQRIREKGYERIGFVGGTTSRRVFVAGFLQAQLDMPDSSRVPPLLVPAPDPPDMQERLAKWIEKYKPDAIFTDLLRVPPMLKAAGYRVPQDIGLAGTSLLDIDVDAGIDQHPEEVGRVAVLVLISLINDNDRGGPAIQREILVKGTWVDGSSMPSRV
jgi:DNA-binding LacI/PurR family transcriptional regulator